MDGQAGFSQSNAYILGNSSMNSDKTYTQRCGQGVVVRTEDMATAQACRKARISSRVLT